MKDGNIIYTDGKVFIDNYDLKEGTLEVQQREYQDNIKEIIKIENLIEELQDSKIKLENDINVNTELIESFNDGKKSYIKLWIVATIFAGILSLVFSPNMIITSTLAMSLLSTSFFGFFYYLDKQKVKFIKKENKCFQLQLEELETELNNNNMLLKELENNKTQKNQKEAEEKKYDNINNIHREKYKQIKKQLYLYKHIIFNEKEFLKYYNEDKLDDKLKEEYEPEEIATIKKYFKSKNLNK